MNIESKRPTWMNTLGITNPDAIGKVSLEEMFELAEAVNYPNVSFDGKIYHREESVWAVTEYTPAEVDKHTEDLCAMMLV